jgi:hypothetical protein
LDADQSKVCSQQLLSEIASLGSVDDAAIWAQKILPVKNTLSSTDAQMVEQAFAARISTLESDAAGIVSDSAIRSRENPKTKAARRTSVDKSVLLFGEPRRYRNKAHLKFVSSQPCLVCGRQPSDAHHLRFTQARALGRKVSDEFTVPLCRGHHRELHRFGNEQHWWQRMSIEPVKVARKLWRKTRLDEGHGEADSSQNGLSKPQADVGEGARSDKANGRDVTVAPEAS